MKKNRIGIITFHASNNCGSMLQTFALQTVLNKDFSQDVEIINYSNLGQRNYYSNWDFFPKISVLKNNIKSIGKYKEINEMKKDYYDFSTNHFNLSGKLLKHHFQLKDDNYDIVVAGGDQVWNVRCRDADKAYFLDFVKNAKRVSYSPSLGAININDKALFPNQYRKLLNKFDYLSVRESNGQKWINELIGKNIPIIADPTLLLNKEQWIDELKLKKSNIKGKYILFYGFYYNNIDNNKKLMELSKKLEMPIYIIDRKSYVINKLDQFNIKIYEKSGPIGFLELLYNAEYVLVQSFHGIIFSALFHKKFWSLRNAIIKNPKDDRAKCILKQLGLEDRIVIYDDLLKVDLDKKINYELVDKKIGIMKKNAYEYIESFLD